MPRGKIPPKISESRQFDVNRKGQVEAIWQPLYDFQTYAFAGTTSTYTFFAVPNGQSSKTFADTNMEMAAALPAPKSMLVTGIEVVFLPPDNPQLNGTQTALEAASQWNDAYVMFKNGYLDFFIGSKSYLIDAPIGKFSNSFRLGGAAAIAAAGEAVDNTSQIGYAAFVGPLYEITPIKLVSNQNFNVTLNFPTTTALPGGADGRIGVILNGFLYRLSQ